MRAAHAGAWPAPGARRRPLAVCAVVAGHAALLLLVWQARRLPVGSSELRSSVVLQLLPPRPADPVPARPAPRLTPPAAAVRAEVPPVALVPVPALPAVVSGGEAAAGPSVAAPSAAGEGVPGVAASPGGTASGPRALDLRPHRDVLRGALVNPATVDPRSNSPKPTFEERIAMGLDPSLCVKLERDPDGTVRRRMGRLGRAQSLLQSTQGVGAMAVLVCE